MDFKLGYSPERINPGDRTHALEKVKKVVSGEDASELRAGGEGLRTRRGPFGWLKAAKVIENTRARLEHRLDERAGAHRRPSWARPASKAESLGYHPEVILAGRRINDGMGAFIGQRLVKLLIAADLPVKGAKVGVLGLTFKENVPDLRNSRVPDIRKGAQASSASRPSCMTRTAMRTRRTRSTG